MEEFSKINRRRFLQTSFGSITGLILSARIPLPLSAATKKAEGVVETVNPLKVWLRIAPDETVTVLIPQAEMGQGVFTSLPMLVAEELEVDFSNIRALAAPAEDAYINPIFKVQATGGSTSIRGFFKPLRQVGAKAREMLKLAAATRWGTKSENCYCKKGFVYQKGSSRKASYGQLAEAAAKQAVPAHVPLKKAENFKIIGTTRKRLDSAEKVRGKTLYAMDMKLPGMLTATVKTCPVFAGDIKSFDDSQARSMPGVVGVFPLPKGVGVVADNYWHAQNAMDSLEIQWELPEETQKSSRDIFKQFEENLKKPGVIARREGDVVANLKKAGKVIEAKYRVPFLAHTTMSPMNCLVLLEKDRCEIWAPTQGQGQAKAKIAAMSGLPPEQIILHTTQLGCGFGRRAESAIIEAGFLLSREVQKPVKVVLSRVEDIQHDYYRPCALSYFKAALDDSGFPLTWSNKIVAPSIMKRFNPAINKTGLDPTSVQGAKEIPYAIPHIQVNYVMTDVPVPIGWWRSVGHSFNACFVECFLDEVARAGGKDPYELRRKLLRDKPREKAVLQLVAEKAGWGKPLPTGVKQGIAIHKSFGTIVALVVEISFDYKDNYRIKRVYCAVDCGQVINPDTIMAQMMSGIIFGLTAARMGEITIEKGRVVQTGFTDYPTISMKEAPPVEVFIIPGKEAPGGIGECGVPPAAPALVNALVQLTGKPIRQLPIDVG
ncbi:molybdopterin cofactor-binding domain-containing protein [Candidatus Riflebacteria bacterium]